MRMYGRWAITIAIFLEENERYHDRYYNPRGKRASPRQSLYSSRKTCIIRTGSSEGRLDVDRNGTAENEKTSVFIAFLL